MADYLERAVREGSYVVLKSGAIAMVRRNYAAGYKGIVDLLLDGEETSERAGDLLLPDPQPLQLDGDTSSVAGDTELEDGLARADSKRMED
jgi:hypothetical protein